MDPVALKIQDLIPLPTRPGVVNNFQQNFSEKTGAKLFNTKIDHNISSTAKLAFYYSHKLSNGWTGPDDLPSPLTAVRRGVGNQPTLRLNYYQNFSPTVMFNFGVVSFATTMQIPPSTAFFNSTPSRNSDSTVARQRISQV
jgi:hypothetical protein